MCEHGLTRRGRQAMLRWPVLPILGGTFAFCLTVFLAWNSEHNWSAFHFFPRSLFRAPVQLAVAGDSRLWSLLPLFAWALVETAMQRPLTYEPAFLYAFTWPLLAIDMLAAHTLDWPQAGFCAWLPAVVMLTALHVLQSKHVSPRIGVWLRTVVLCITALQSILLLQAGATPLLRSNDKLYGWGVSAKSIREALQGEHLLDGRPLHFMADRCRWPRPFPFTCKVSTLPAPITTFPSSKARLTALAARQRALGNGPPKEASLIPTHRTRSSTSPTTRPAISPGVSCVRSGPAHVPSPFLR